MKKVCIFIYTVATYRHLFHLLHSFLTEQGVTGCVATLGVYDAAAAKMCRNIGWKSISLDRGAQRSKISEFVYRSAHFLWMQKNPRSDIERIEKKDRLIRLGKKFVQAVNLAGVGKGTQDIQIGKAYEMLAQNKAFYVFLNLLSIRSWAYFVPCYIAKVLHIFGISHNALVVWAAKLDRNTRFTDFLREEKPDLILAEAACFGPVYLSEAYRLNIPVAYYVPSWDRVPGHGSLPVPFAHTMVWGPSTLRDMQQFHSEFGDRVTVVGSTHFDAYNHAPKTIGRADYCRLINADPARKIVTVFLGQAIYDATNIPLVADVIDIIFGNGDRHNIHVVLRFYPGETQGQIKDKISPDLPISFQHPPDNYFDPALDGWESDVDLPVRMAAFMHSDLVISPAGSANFDGLWFGKQVINVVYDPPETPFHKSVRYWMELSDCVKMMNSPGVRVAASKEELRTHIFDALAHPAAMSEERSETLSDIIGPTDGHVHERIADCVAKLLKKTK